MCLCAFVCVWRKCLGSRASTRLYSLYRLPDPACYPLSSFYISVQSQALSFRGQLLGL